MKLNKSQREEVKMKFGGFCSYCGELLGEKWQADHLIPIRRNGDGTCLNPEHDVIENLMPACVICNKNKHSFTLDFWRKQLEDSNRKLREYVANYRLALMFGQVQETEQPIIFHFEKWGNV